MQEYKYIEEQSFLPSGGAYYVLKKRIPCSNIYFIEAFWMPIKKQIGKKLVFLLNNDQLHFQLIYNSIASKMDRDQYENDKKEFAKVVRIALRHIDNIMAHFYNGKEEDPSIVPFFDPACPIQSVIDDNIIMTGRLPMQEEYFIKKYWSSLIEPYQKRHPGTEFKIHFLDLCTKITVSAECRKKNAIRKRKGLPECDSKSIMKPAVQEIICDLTDAVLQAASDYSLALGKY